MRAIGSRAHRRSRGHTHRCGRLGVTLRMRDFFQLVQTISFNVGKTARKEPIALPSRVTQVRRSTYKLEDNIGPVVLIAVGVGAAFIPGMAEAQLSPTIVLTIFRPFLLYWESLSVSLVRMKRVLRGVILSATILVIITAGIIAGAGAGLLWGMIFTRLMPRIIRIDNDPLLAVLCTSISPFVAFFVAEELHGSGVLAVVTAGVVSSWRGAGTQLFGLTQVFMEPI